MLERHTTDHAGVEGKQSEVIAALSARLTLLEETHAPDNHVAALMERVEQMVILFRDSFSSVQTDIDEITRRQKSLEVVLNENQNQTAESLSPIDPLPVPAMDEALAEVKEEQVEAEGRGGDVVDLSELASLHMQELGPLREALRELDQVRHTIAHIHTHSHTPTHTHTHSHLSQSPSQPLSLNPLSFLSLYTTMFLHNVRDLYPPPQMSTNLGGRRRGSSTFTDAAR